MEKPTAADIDNAIDVLARARLTSFASFTHGLMDSYYLLAEKRVKSPLERQRFRLIARLLGYNAQRSPEMGISLMHDDGWD